MKLLLAVLALPMVVSGFDGKRYQVNLDDPPRQRWKHIAEDFRDMITSLELSSYAYNFSQFMGFYDEKLLDDWFEAQWEVMEQEWREELMGFVEAVDHPNLTVKSLFLRNARYELGISQDLKKIFGIGCTGIVAANPNGTVVHGRNLDLGFDLKLVRKYTFLVTFMRGGKPLFESYHHPTQLGVHTAHRIGGYSLAQNTRWDERLKDANVNLLPEYIDAARLGAKTAQLGARRILQDAADFEQAVAMVQASKWLSPSYYVLAGSGPWQGAVITLDHAKSPKQPDVRRLSKHGPQFLVQTNDDSWLPPVDDRRGTGMSLLATRLPEVTAGLVKRTMRSPPICNPGTVFTFVCKNHINKCELDMSDCPMPSSSLRSRISFNGKDLLPDGHVWGTSDPKYSPL